MPTLTFSVPGPPMAKPRMTRRDRWKLRPCVVRYREWCDRARLAAGEVPTADRVTDLSWVACFRPAPSWSQKRQLEAIGKPHRQAPDRDNIDKAVLDCLYPKGDQGIARGTIEKKWVWEPRIVITIKYQ